WSGESDSAGISSSRRLTSSLLTWRASQRERRLTIWSSGLVDIGAQQHVLSDLLGVQTAQRDGRSELGEGVRTGPGERRGDEEQQLVDEILGEEGARQRRPTLEQQRLHALRGERGELLAKRPSAQLELRLRGQRTAAE